MILLAIDTTAVSASAALMRDGKVIASLHSEAGAARGELLLPMIESCLSVSHLTFGDIDAYACTNGPGSFTGVRIGVATVKGLAFGKDLPCVPVSTLEAIAENLRPLRGVYCAAMDARRGEVYTALFDTDEEGNLRRLTADEAIPVSLLAERVRPYLDGRPVFAAGDGAHVAKKALKDADILCEETPALLSMQTASSVARVAQAALLRGFSLDCTKLSPIYLRVPQAERERLAKQTEA